MDNGEDNEDFKKFLLEMKCDEDLITAEPTKSTPDPIDVTNIEQKIYENVSHLLDLATGVAEVMKEKIDTGTPFAADVQAFAAAMNSLGKGIDVMSNKIEPEKKMMLAHKLKLEADAIKHKNALELQDKKNEAKSLGSNNNITQNNYLAVGSNEEIMQALENNRTGLIEV
mgnify:CR=1 FL=1